MYFRSDMAKEVHDRFMKQYAKEHKGEPDGIRFDRRVRGGFEVSRVTVTNENGAALLGRPVGTYVTLSVGRLWQSSEDELERAADLTADVLASAGVGGKVLVVGLGNDRVTADAVGPCAARHVVATHHVKNRAPLGDAAVVIPGVLGQTGIGASSLIRAAADEVEPDTVVVIDALAAGSVGTLGVTVQITDTGIRPGSGVGNDRGELSSAVLGVPTVAIGVPTVADAAIFLPDGAPQSSVEALHGMYVCPKDCDAIVAALGRMTGYAVNRVCHPSLPYREMGYI
jgi:spore protease